MSVFVFSKVNWKQREVSESHIKCVNMNQREINERILQARILSAICFYRDLNPMEDINIINFLLAKNLHCIAQQADTTQNPLLRPFLGLEVKCPDKGWTALSGSVHWALVHSLCLLLVNRHSLDINNRHGRGQVLQVTLLYHTANRG